MRNFQLPSPSCQSHAQISSRAKSHIIVSAQPPLCRRKKTRSDAALFCEDLGGLKCTRKKVKITFPPSPLASEGPIRETRQKKGKWLCHGPSPECWVSLTQAPKILGQGGKESPFTLTQLLRGTSPHSSGRRNREGCDERAFPPLP